MRLAEDGLETHAGGPQSQAEVVVLLAPADESLVEPIDAHEVVTPDAEVAAGEPRLCGMTRDRMPPGRAPPASEGAALGRRHKRHQIRDRQILGHQESVGLGGESGAVAKQGGAVAAAIHVGRNVVMRHDAVAVEEQQVAARREPRGLVANPREAEAVVRLGHKTHGKRGCGCERVDDLRRLVARAVVRNDHLHRRSAASLQCQRLERERQVSWPTVRGHEHRHIDGPTAHARCP